MSKQLLEMSIAVGGWRPQHSEDQFFCGVLFGSSSMLLGQIDHRQVPVSPLLVRCKCAESTHKYWDKTCLQLSSIQGSGLDMAEVFVEQFNGIERLML